MQDDRFPSSGATRHLVKSGDKVLKKLASVA
jgi:hypothetical protein